VLQTLASIETALQSRSLRVSIGVTALSRLGKVRLSGRTRWPARWRDDFDSFPDFELCFVRPMAGVLHAKETGVSFKASEQNLGSPGESRSSRHVSNHPFPNRTGTFQRIRLSGYMWFVFPGLYAPSGTTRYLPSTFPCTPSPCIGHYPDHLSTMGAPTPWGSRPVGVPLVTCLTVPLRRSPFRRCPSH